MSRLQPHFSRQLGRFPSQDAGTFQITLYPWILFVEKNFLKRRSWESRNASLRHTREERPSYFLTRWSQVGDKPYWTDFEFSSDSVFWFIYFGREVCHVVFLSLFKVMMLSRVLVLVRRPQTQSRCRTFYFPASFSGSPALYWLKRFRLRSILCQ